MKRETNRLIRMMVLAAAVSALSGCGIFGRLSRVGQEPEFTRIENPVKQKDYKPIDMPMPEPQTPYVNANSLWRPGSKGFFKDQRASQVGDILTVRVVVSDNALLENKSEQKRGDDKDSLSIGALAGLEKYAGKIFPAGVDPSDLFNITSSRDISGDASIDRNEKIDVTMAAIVTQVLPNGNLVISGKQEVRVNYEMRQLHMTGIIRREDISTLNTIKSDKIAELRVAYGGKGTMSDVQQPRYGRQVLDIVSPF